MTAYELHDLLSANRELISDTWYFFLTVHLAVFGIVYIASGRIRLIERFVLIFAYLSFMYVNYAAQMDNYDAYERLIGAINALGGEAGETARYLVVREPVWISSMLQYVYGAAASAASVIIILINRDRT